MIAKVKNLRENRHCFGGISLMDSARIAYVHDLTIATFIAKKWRELVKY